MKAVFQRPFREAAIQAGRPLIGFVVTGPDRKSGGMTTQTFNLKKEQADALSCFMVNLLNAGKTPDEAFAESFGKPENAKLWEPKN